MCLMFITLHFLLQYDAVCAESNAILSAFRVRADLTSSVLFITSPLCIHCAKIIVQSGVKEVICSSSEQEMKKEDVAAMFIEAGIKYR